MPDLGNAQNIHIDVFLTTVSIAYTNEDYAHDQVAGIVPVPKVSDRFPIYNRDVFLSGSGTDAQGNLTSIRRPRTRSTEITWDVSNQTFLCEQYAKNYLLPDQEVQLADNPIQPSIDATMSLTETIFIDMELLVAAKAGLRTNYATANKAQLTSGGTGTSWKNNATPYATTQYSFPISVDIPNGQRAVMLSGLRAPNRMLLNYGSATTLAANWEYRDAFKGVSTEAMTRAGLVPVVKGLEIIEARAQKKTSAGGVTPVTTGYIWQDDAGEDTALIYYWNPQITGLRTLTSMLQFDAPDATLNTHNVVTKRWREEWNDGERIEVRTTRDCVFSATDGSTNGLNSNGYASLSYLLSGVTL
jgi:hypothetical protein